jgi:tRNA-dihydrouridine synthase
MLISLAPLQGFTEFPFRNAMHSIIGGVDRYYTPFLRLENDGTLKKKYIKDIDPQNNAAIPLIPQILVNNATDFLFLAKIIEDFGYTEVNWNLGCPFPMVAKRKLGSGLIPFPQDIQQILETSLPKTSLKVSIKIRAGYLQHTEIFPVLEVLESFPVKEIILHPRVGKQMYGGLADATIFEQALKKTTHPLGYNGDIDSLSSFESLQSRFPTCSHWMIGRALVGNPFLASEIKDKKSKGDQEKRKLMEIFHESLLNHYRQTLEGDGHLHTKMVHFWEYFANQFENPHKVYKPIKKSRKFNDYQAAVIFAIRNEPLKSFNIQNSNDFPEKQF